MAHERKLPSAWVSEYCMRPAGIAGFFMLLALLGTFLLQQVVAYPFLFLFFGAIMASAWFGGLIAGVLAIAMSYVLIAFFFIPPLYDIAVGKESRSYVAAYMMCAIAITVVSSSRKRAENAIRKSNEELETRVQQRTAELEQSHQEILERERQLRLLAEAIPLQIWSSDASGQIEYCNRDMVNYLGKQPHELGGEGFFAIFHSGDAENIRESWETARASNTPFEAQARIRSRDAEYRWFLVRGIPQRVAAGSIVRWYGVHVDIDERQREQERILLAQESLQRFTRTLSMAEMAASIAHELHQPLTATAGHAAACQRWLSADPPNLQRASVAAQRMSRDISRAGNVLARIRSLFDKTDCVREPTDLNQLIVDLVGLLRGDGLRRGVSIQLRLAEELPALNVDRVQIQQVLLNLAVNGMDAMMETDRPRILEICSEMHGDDAVLVAVKDCGPGFGAHGPIRVFEPFVTTKPEGMGMGLAICRSIIEAHEGRIWATRTEEGAVFQFVLKVDAT